MKIYTNLQVLSSATIEMLVNAQFGFLRQAKQYEKKGCRNAKSFLLIMPCVKSKVHKLISKTKFVTLNLGNEH
jgi:hypothetical protein